jgi:ferredoxin
MFAEISERLTPDQIIIVAPYEWIFVRPPWHRGRIALIGDAAHATAPTIGSAGGMAVEDAVVGLQQAVVDHQLPGGEDVRRRLPPTMNLSSRKMGIHEWSYHNDYNPAERRLMPHVSLRERFARLDIEVELGFTADQTVAEVQRCLNCDVQTVFADRLCIECDACIDICPTDCLTIARNGPEEDLRGRLKAPAEKTDQALFVSEPLKQTGRVMVKDENLCVHCGLCAERCPTAAWDMQKSTFKFPRALDEEAACQSRQRRKA